MEPLIAVKSLATVVSPKPFFTQAFLIVVAQVTRDPSGALSPFYETQTFTNQKRLSLFWFIYISVGLGGGMGTLLVENDIFSYLVLSGSFAVCYSLLKTSNYRNSKYFTVARNTGN